MIALKLILANWRLVLLGLILLALGIQTMRLNNAKTEFAEYRVNIEKQVAEQQVKNAQERARIASNATKALDDLQVRLNAASARYKRLRDSASPSGVPSLASAAPSLSACPAEPSKPDPVAGALDRLEAGVLEILEAGDLEISKYVELWLLQQNNATK